MRAQSLLLAIFILYLHAVTVECKYDIRSIKTGKNENWVFLSKFCFDTEGLGNLTWTITDNKSNNLSLILYDDENWGDVYSKRNDLSCEELLEYQKGSRTVYSGVTRVQPFNDPTRPHMWYTVVADCSVKGSLDFHYDFHFINAGGIWTREFSYDEQGMTQAYLALWLFFVALCGINLWCSWNLFRTNSYQPLAKLLTGALLLEFFSMLFTFIHYAVYMHNGKGSPGLFGLGELADASAQMILCVLLILVAKGWTITTSEIKHKRLLIILTSLFLLGYLTMFVWDRVARDPASSQYVYDSAPGICVLVLRMIMYAWFLWCLYDTWHTAPEEKRLLFVPFGTFFSLWFLLLPLIAIIAASEPAYTRYKIVQAMYITLSGCAFSALIYLFLPYKVREYSRTIVSTEVLEASNPLLSTPYDTL